jgi:hypothetical protein
MLDSIDGNARVAEAGGVIEAGEVGDAGGDFDAYIGAKEANAVFGRGRLQLESHGLAGVKPDPGTADGTSQRPSIGHLRRGSLSDAWTVRLV